LPDQADPIVEFLSEAKPGVLVVWLREEDNLQKYAASRSEAFELSESAERRRQWDQAFRETDYTTIRKSVKVVSAEVKDRRRKLWVRTFDLAREILDEMTDLVGGPSAHEWRGGRDSPLRCFVDAKGK
jgi:hypothetical protein